MASPRKFLGDAPDRSYAAKLELFSRFAAPELRQIFADLSLPTHGTVLDLGCGTGRATLLLREAVSEDVLVAGVDLSLPHLQFAHRQHDLPFILGDVEQLCLANESFDIIWCCNTINHVADRVKVLRHLGRLLKPGGRLVLAQSGFLQEMFFAWDSHLDDSVRMASHRYYRERYGLEPQDTEAIRALVGLVQQAGFAEVNVRTYVIERTQPLSSEDREYFEQAVVAGLWNRKLRPYLDAPDVAKLELLCDPESPEYWLDRNDFHHIQTISVCQSRMII